MKLATFVGLVLLVCATAFGAPASPVTVDLHQTSLTEISTVERDRITYVSAMELFALFNGRLYWAAEKRKLVANLNGTDITLTENSPYAQKADSSINLIMPPFIDNGDLMVPVVPLCEMLNDLLPDLVAYESQKKIIKVLATTQVIRKSLCEEKKNGTLYTLFLPDSMLFDYTYFKPRLNINISKAKISAPDLAMKAGTGKVREVQAFQFTDNAQIGIQLSDDATEPEVSFKRNPPRIEVVIRNSVILPALPSKTGEQSEAVPPSKPAQRIEPAPAQPPEPAAANIPAPQDSEPVESAQASTNAPKPPQAPLASKIKTIIIDPGHGGRDAGAVNGKDTEKEAVLAIALKLKTKLQEALPSVKIILTRSDDTFIPLQDRSKIANSHKGDLFISIHANAVKGNAVKKASISGYVVYFLDVARDDEARAAEALENSAIEHEEKQPFEAKSDIDFILKSSELNAYRDQSEQLAICLEQEMKKDVNEITRYKTGVNQAGFYVLRGPEMPSVLIETAFISNPKEALLLKKGYFQETMAQAICKGVVHFKEKCEKALP